MLTVTARGPDLRVETDRLVVCIDRGTGALRRVENPASGQVLVDGPPRGAPWRLRAQGAAPLLSRVIELAIPTAPHQEVTPRSFSALFEEDALRLEWETSEPGVRVVVSVRAGARGEILLFPLVEVFSGCKPPVELTYPILTRPQEFSPDGNEDYLLFPVHSGLLTRRPLAGPAFDAGYPDGYWGCSLQMLAYFKDSGGGFYVAAHDPHSTWKGLHFSAEELSIRHEAWDLRAGASMSLGYPVVLAPLDRGDWYEAAELYRSWAIDGTPWCQALSAPRPDPAVGTADRSQCSWLRGEVGVALWGPPSALDWSPWYRYWSSAFDSRLHISSGWEWPATRPNSLGEEGWFPANFHSANVDAWRGQYVTPYMNDLFISRSAQDFTDRWEPALMYPYSPFPWSRFTERSALETPEIASLDARVTTNTDYFACPAADAQQELHAWRATQLMKMESLSGACYDISSGNPMFWSRCWRSEHGHAPGRGRGIIDAYGAQNRRSRAQAWNDTGRYLVQGVETIIENLIDSVDFYVARAGAGPLGVLEAWVPQPEDQPGRGRELVPLFDAVYHDVGPVREDGWLNVSEEIGELFYWAAARIVLQWGALLSLLYASAPPEELPGSAHQPTPEIVDWDGSLVRFRALPKLDPEKVNFVAELARARTQAGARYLPAGALRRPLPPRDPGTCRLDFHRRFYHIPRLAVDGEWTVPRVVHGAWGAENGDLGLFYVNVTRAPVFAQLPPAVAGLWPEDVAGRAIRVTTGSDAADRGRVGAHGEIALALELPPRQVVLVELIGATGTLPRP